MMPLWQSFLLVAVIPPIGAVSLILLSSDYRYVEISLVTLGAGAIAVVSGWLTLGVSISATGRPAKRALDAAWIFSILVGFTISYLLYMWDFPGWIHTMFQWLGAIIGGFSLAALLSFILASGCVSGWSRGQSE